MVFETKPEQDDAQCQEFGQKRAETFDAGRGVFEGRDRDRGQERDDQVTPQNIENAPGPLCIDGRLERGSVSGPMPQDPKNRQGTHD